MYMVDFLGCLFVWNNHDDMYQSEIPLSQYYYSYHENSWIVFILVSFTDLENQGILLAINCNLMHWDPIHWTIFIPKIKSFFGSYHCTIHLDCLIFTFVRASVSGTLYWFSGQYWNKCQKQIFEQNIKYSCWTSVIILLLICFCFRFLHLNIFFWYTILN